MTTRHVLLGSFLFLVSLAAGCHGSLYALSQQHYQKMCTDPQFAFESGYNSGVKRRPLDTSWAVEKCQPNLRKQARTSYVAGYREGIEQAPNVVPIQVRTSAAGYQPAVTSCTFSSDCGDDMSCRKWGDAGDVCMGYGSSGDPCWFGSDCLSGDCDVVSGQPGKVCR